MSYFRVTSSALKASPLGLQFYLIWTQLLYKLNIFNRRKNGSSSFLWHFLLFSEHFRDLLEEIGWCEQLPIETDPMFALSVCRPYMNIWRRETCFKSELFNSCEYSMNLQAKQQVVRILEAGLLLLWSHPAVYDIRNMRVCPLPFNFKLKYMDSFCSFTLERTHKLFSHDPKWCPHSTASFWHLKITLKHGTLAIIQGLGRWTARVSNW